MRTFKNMAVIGSVVTIALSLSACMPHLNKQQCQNMNWYQVGFTDGSQAKNQRDLSRDIKDCAKFKLDVNTKQYTKGWRAGTRQYCQPNTAYQLGANGKTYNHICPAGLSNAFNQAWHRGLRRYCVPTTGYSLGHAGRPMPGFCSGGQIVAFRRAYQRGLNLFMQTRDAQAQVNSTTKQIAGTRHQIQAKRNQIASLQNQITTGIDQHGNQIPWPQRVDMQRQITYLNQDIFHLNIQLRQLNRQLSRQQQNLAGLKAS